MKALTSALIGRSVSCDHMAARRWDQLFQNKVDSGRRGECPKRKRNVLLSNE